MTQKFTVTLWEQRRIEMEIEAEDEQDAETTATAIWDQIPDMDAVYGINEVKAIDNHDLKSIIVTKESK